jgi:hypothetical protein
VNQQFNEEEDLLLSALQANCRNAREFRKEVRTLIKRWFGEPFEAIVNEPLKVLQSSSCVFRRGCSAN